MGEDTNGRSSNSDVAEGRLLDGFLLLAAGGSSNPDDIVKCNVSSLSIVDVASEDLSFFAHLDHLDISDNKLNYERVLEQLSFLPKVSTILLSCNSISTLTVPSGAFTQLQALDLSFNELHGDVLTQLANLPKLKSLNLSSNCISSIPPEENLYGLQSLEELNLDSNDLVQYDQWRSLDAIPKLKRLSMGSNRIKRLRDDQADGQSPNGLFISLVELDLGSNEIADFDSLSLLRLFKSLRAVDLSDNPATRNAGRNLSADVLPFPHVELISRHSAAWYLKGSGCFKKVPEKPVQKMRIDRGRFRKVSDKLKPLKQSRNRDQIAIYDEQTGTLQMDLRADDLNRPVRDGEPYLFETEPDLSSGPILDENITEDQLDQIFKDRREYIERMCTAGSGNIPQSFMKQIPFPVSAAAGEKLGLRRRPESPTSAKRSSAFLTETGEAEESQPPLDTGLGRTLRKKEVEKKEVEKMPEQGASPRTEAPEVVDDKDAMIAALGAQPNAAPPTAGEAVKEAMRALRTAMMNPEYSEKG